MFRLFSRIGVEFYNRGLHKWNVGDRLTCRARPRIGWSFECVSPNVFPNDRHCCVFCVICICLGAITHTHSSGEVLGEGLDTGSTPSTRKYKNHNTQNQHARIFPFHVAFISVFVHDEIHDATTYTHPLRLITRWHKCVCMCFCACLWSYVSTCVCLCCICVWQWSRTRRLIFDNRNKQRYAIYMCLNVSIFVVESQANGFMCNRWIPCINFNMLPTCHMRVVFMLHASIFLDSPILTRIIFFCVFSRGDTAHNSSFPARRSSKTELILSGWQHSKILAHATHASYTSLNYLQCSFSSSTSISSLQTNLRQRAARYQTIQQTLTQLQPTYGWLRRQ